MHIFARLMQIVALLNLVVVSYGLWGKNESFDLAKALLIVASFGAIAIGSSLKKQYQENSADS